MIGDPPDGGEPSVGDFILDFPLQLLPNGYDDVIGPDITPTDGGLALFVADWAPVTVLAGGAGRHAAHVRHRPGDRPGRESGEGPGDSGAPRHHHPGLHDHLGRQQLLVLRRRRVLRRVPGRGRGGHHHRRPGRTGRRTWNGTVDEFIVFCNDHGWTPCLYSTTEATKRATDRLGWPSLQVAEETVLGSGRWPSAARSSRTSARRSAGRGRRASARSGSSSRTRRWPSGTRSRPSPRSGSRTRRCPRWASPSAASTNSTTGTCAA